MGLQSGFKYSSWLFQLLEELNVHIWFHFPFQLLEKVNIHLWFHSLFQMLERVNVHIWFHCLFQLPEKMNIHFWFYSPFQLLEKVNIHIWFNFPFQLLEEVNIHILPSLNPDGAEQSTVSSCDKGPGHNNVNNVDLDTNFKQTGKPKYANEWVIVRQVDSQFYRPVKREVR